MGRIERLHKIAEELRNRRMPVSAAVLAELFDVSERTVYRDVQTLRDLGTRIDGASGFGYVLSDAGAVASIPFSTVELDALALGLRFVRRRSDPDLVGAARSAQAKIEACLDRDTKVNLLANGLLVGPAEDLPAEACTIRQAIEDEVKLRLSYLDKNGAPTKRTIWPIALGFFERSHVLAAWCELRADYRHFSLARIERLDVLDERSPRPRRVLLGEWRKTQPEIDL